MAPNRGLWLWAAMTLHVSWVALSLYNEFLVGYRSHHFRRDSSLQARPADVPRLDPSASRIDQQTWTKQQQDGQHSAPAVLPTSAPILGPTSAPGGPDPSIVNANAHPTLGPGSEPLPPPALQPSPAPPLPTSLAPTLVAPTPAPLLPPTPEPAPEPIPAPTPTPAPAPTPPTTPSNSSPGPPPKYRHYKFKGYLAPPDPVCRNAKFRPEIEAAAAAVRDLRHSTESRCPDWKKWARDWVEKQFEPWKDGITTAMHTKTGRYRYRGFPPTEISLEAKDKSGKLHLSYKGGRVSWKAYMGRAIKNWPFNASELKPFRVWAEHWDWPAIVKEDPEAVGTAPAIGDSFNDNFIGVMMPTGGRPQYLDEEIDDRREVPKHAAMRKTAFELGDKVPWKDRADVAVWRGMIGCTFGVGERGKYYYPNMYLENHSQSVRFISTKFQPLSVGTGYGCMETEGKRSNLWMRHPRFLVSLYTISCGKECGLDAKSFGGRHASWVNHEIEESGEPNLPWHGAYMSDEHTAASRYVFNIGNHGYADRWWRMLAFGSVVLNVEMGWKEWFSPLMIPYVNYVPVREDLADVCEQLAWLRENPEEAELIAKRGREVVEQCIHIPMVDIYSAEVVRQLGALWEKGRLKEEAEKLEKQQREKEQKEQHEQSKQSEQKTQEGAP